jgi:hypothetical protein
MAALEVPEPSTFLTIFDVPGGLLGGLVPLAEDLSDTLVGHPGGGSNLAETVPLPHRFDDAVAERALSPLRGGSPPTNAGKRGGLAFVTRSS